MNPESSGTVHLRASSRLSAPGRSAPVRATVFGPGPVSGNISSGMAGSVAGMTETTQTTDQDTPWEPPLNGTEAEHVLGALDRLRWTFRYKADELDAAGLDTRIGAS